MQSEEEIINVDFDFFDVDKDVDFHAIKHLLRQLIGDDSKKINLSALTDFALDALTTTIKTDGKEGDPYLFLAPINIKDLKKNDYFKYLHSFDAGLSSFINKISHKKVALLLSERLINMPIQVIPPTYKMVLDELNKQNSSFDYFIIPSRKYEVNVDQDDKTNKKVKPATEVDYYHYEDQYLEENSAFRFELPAKGGLIQTFIIVDQDNLIRSIDQLEEAISAAI